MLFSKDHLGAGAESNAAADNPHHLAKGRLPVPNLMNFRKTSKRPLTPTQPYFRKTMLRFFREAQKFATKFIRIGVTTPLFPPKITGKTATKFLDRK